MECMRHVSDVEWPNASAEALLWPEQPSLSDAQHVPPGPAVRPRKVQAPVGANAGGASARTGFKIAGNVLKPGHFHLLIWPSGGLESAGGASGKGPSDGSRPLGLGRAEIPALALYGHPFASRRAFPCQAKVPAGLFLEWAQAPPGVCKTRGLFLVGLPRGAGA